MVTDGESVLMTTKKS